MHEFISSITLKKNDCASCRTRIELVCIKCGNCWDCHWKREQAKNLDFGSKCLIPTKDIIF